jgi:hypothetical protein
MIIVFWKSKLHAHIPEMKPKIEGPTFGTHLDFAQIGHPIVWFHSLTWRTYYLFISI